MHTIRRKARNAFDLVAKDLLPRFKAPLVRPIRILASLPEYRARTALAATSSRAEAYAIGDLSSRGYMMLPDAPAAYGELAAAASAKLEETLAFAPRGSKSFFSQLLSGDDRRLDGPFMRAALDERILAAVARYLGCAPYLEYVELLHSRPVETLTSSQLWHLDRTDRRLVKLFVFCRDVAEENGPFSFLDAADSSGVPDYLSHYLTDERIAAYADLSRTIRILGKAGTAFLIDTSRCYHFGSRCKQPRLAFTVYYSSGFGYQGRESAWNPSSDDLAGLTPLQKAALGKVAP